MVIGYRYCFAKINDSEILAEVIHIIVIYYIVGSDGILLYARLVNPSGGSGSTGWF